MIELTNQNIDVYSFPDVFTTACFLTPHSIELHFPEYFHIEKMVEKPCLYKILWDENAKTAVLLHDNKWHAVDVLDYIDLVITTSINDNGEFEMCASMPDKGVFVLKSTHTKVYFKEIA